MRRRRPLRSEDFRFVAAPHQSGPVLAAIAQLQEQSRPPVAEALRKSQEEKFKVAANAVKCLVLKRSAVYD